MDVNYANQAQSTREDERWQTYLKERRSEHEMQLSQLNTDQQKEIDAEIQLHKKQMEDLKTDYKVELSRTHDSLEKQIADTQKAYEVALKTENESHEKEFDKLREREL